MVCFNRKVLIGLGAVALGVLAFAPQAFSRILPLLVVAVCPLSMLLMMRRGSGASCQTGKTGTGDTVHVDAEIARLRAEVERLRAERLAAGGTTTPSGEASLPRSVPGR